MATYFFVHVPARAAENLRLGIARSVWGWKDDALDIMNHVHGGVPNRAIAQRIRTSDFIVFGHKGPDPRATAPTYEAGVFERVAIAQVRQPLRYATAPIWQDDIYPNRLELEFLEFGDGWGTSELTREGMAALRTSANLRGVAVPSTLRAVPGFSNPTQSEEDGHRRTGSVSPPAWQIVPGEVLTRREIHGQYGGALFGGIEPSGTTPNVMVYTDLHAGEAYGYVFDGWSRVEDDVFYYSGDGQEGDQDPEVGGNPAIIHHARDGRALRLFATLDRKSPGGGKRQQYIGEFYLDPDQPYDFRTGPDRNGNPRQVIVFRLRAIDATRALSSAGVSDLNFRDVPVVEAPELPRTPPSAPDGKPTVPTAEVTFVASENHLVLEAIHPPRVGKIVEKFEAQLVSEWEHRLRRQGHDVARVRLRIEGEKGDLVTDTLDRTSGILYEAKSSAERSTVRLAIGQLIDYLRFLPELKGSLLLTDEPTLDLQNLIRHAGFGVVYKKLGSWVVQLPPEGAARRSVTAHS